MSFASWPSLPASPTALAAKVAKGELVINVKDYGAKGDNSTDDTVAINAAIVAAGYGGTVFFPRGRYVYTAIVNDRAAFLEGSGYHIQRDGTGTFGDNANYNDVTKITGTVLRCTATSGDSINHVDTITHTGGGISNMAILGPGSGTTVGVRIGRDTPSVKAVIAPEYSNVLVCNFATGYVMHHVNEGRFYSLNVRGCTKALSLVHDVNANSWIGLNVQRCTDGLIMESGGSCYSNTFVSPIMQNMTGTHWTVRGFSNTWISAYHESPSNPVSMTLFDFQTGGLNRVVSTELHCTNPMNINITNQCHYNTFTEVNIHTARLTVTDAGTSNSFDGDFDNGAGLTGAGGNRIITDRRNAYIQAASYRATSGSLPSLQVTNFALRNGASGPTVRWHTTTPEGNISAPVGSLCGRTDAGLWYIKQTGSSTTGWFELAAVAFGSATLDFPSIAAGATSELTITVTGAATGEAVSIGPPSTLNAGLQVTGYVSAANTVTVRVYNSTGSAVDPASATWKAIVVKR